jgi:hypothetical protein
MGTWSVRKRGREGEMHLVRDGVDHSLHFSRRDSFASTSPFMLKEHFFFPFGGGRIWKTSADCDACNWSDGVVCLLFW